jgi:O-antigen ligase
VERKARRKRAAALLADALVVGVAISLPWSTSATAILITLWFLSLLLLVGDATALRQALMLPAGALPVLLWLLGAAGMLWANVSWSERLAGLSGFHKLLFIPVLIAQFRHIGHGRWAILGLLASSAILLITSWALALLPGLTWRGKEVVGVPVKDYVFQSELFAICAFGLIGQAASLWRTHRFVALLLVLGAALFIGNILYVESARTTLVVVAVLACLFGFWQFRWKGALGACVILVAISSATWMTSPYLRERVLQVTQNIETYEANHVNTPVGQRLEYWRKSLKFIASAPVLGHGTGSIPDLFQRDAAPETHPSIITDNPHNQVIVIALELGIVGSVVLLAMWAAHLLLFREHSVLDWSGLMLVVQSVVSCLFNSHLFDFGQGWLYVFGVGIIGGMVLRDRDAKDAGAPPSLNPYATSGKPVPIPPAAPAAHRDSARRPPTERAAADGSQ